MGDRYSLIDIGNISKPIAGVANNFIDKISAALGWAFNRKNIEPAIAEANKSIIEEISNRQDINPIERAAFVNNYKKIVKEYGNQCDIIQKAIEHLNPDAKIEDVNDDWIMFFFDKVKNVSEDYMKDIWAKILSGEFNKPNTYTKQFIHTMSIMDTNLAMRFQKLRSSCFFIPPKLYLFIYRTNNKDINNGAKYKTLNINFKDFRELETIGLIRCRHHKFYTIKKNEVVLYYGSKKIMLSSNKAKIATGNVTLTNTGKQLCSISPMEYREEVLNICIKTWEKLGYNPIIEEVENDD